MQWVPIQAEEGPAGQECAEVLVAKADVPRASLRSLQGTWARLASQAGFSNPFQLTPELVFTVMGVLKAAEYRSAINCLEAAKRRHVLEGHSMNDVKVGKTTPRETQAGRFNVSVCVSGIQG